MGAAAPGSVEHLVRPDPTELDVDHKASLQGKRCSLWESQSGGGVKTLQETQEGALPAYRAQDSTELP